MKNLRRSCLGLALAGLAFGSTGCSVLGHKTATTASGEKVVTQNFKWVYITGSHIPVAVPTDPNVKPVIGISPVVVITADDMHRWGGPMH